MTIDEIRTVCVVGAGTMGSQIAHQIALGGYPVQLYSRSAERKWPMAGRARAQGMTAGAKRPSHRSVMKGGHPGLLLEERSVQPRPSTRAAAAAVPPHLAGGGLDGSRSGASREVARR